MQTLLSQCVSTVNYTDRNNKYLTKNTIQNYKRSTQKMLQKIGLKKLPYMNTVYRINEIILAREASCFKASVFHNKVGARQWNSMFVHGVSGRVHVISCSLSVLVHLISYFKFV